MANSQPLNTFPADRQIYIFSVVSALQAAALYEIRNIL
jgi:hypothetical protein